MGRNRVAKPNKPFEHWRRAPYSRKRGKRFFRFQQVWAFLPKMLPFGAVFPPDHLQVMGVHKGVFMETFLLLPIQSSLRIIRHSLVATMVTVCGPILVKPGSASGRSSLRKDRLL